MVGVTLWGCGVWWVNRFSDFFVFLVRVFSRREGRSFEVFWLTVGVYYLYVYEGFGIFSLVVSISVDGRGFLGS